LSDISYGVILRDFLVSDQSSFLEIIRKWPQDVYDIEAVILAIQDRLQYTNSKPLSEALAELYIREKRFSEALKTLLLLRNEAAFSLIQSQQLYHCIEDNIVDLMNLSSDKYAASLLIWLKALEPHNFSLLTLILYLSLLLSKDLRDNH
jgi:hypothetical protein